MTASACWLAYSAFFLGWLYLGPDSSLYLPISVAVAWIGLGVGLARRPRYHSVGVGIVVGVAVAVVMASTYTVIVFTALADELGDAVAPASESFAVRT